MIFLLGASSSISIADSPDFMPCNYTYHITYYDSPSNAGTINGYTNGQTQTIQRNNVPCGDSAYQGSAQASTSAGYLFSYWASSISLNTALSNPADFIIRPGSVSITAFYDNQPHIDGAYEYDSSGIMGSTAPIIGALNLDPTSPTCATLLTNSTGQPGSYSSSSELCAFFHSSENTDVVLVNFTYDIIDIKYMPSGNISASMTLTQIQGIGANYYNGTSLVTFTDANGQKVNTGDLYYTTPAGESFADEISLLGSILQDLSNIYYSDWKDTGNTTLQNLGNYTADMSWGVMALWSWIDGISYGNLNVGYFATGDVANPIGCGATAVIEILATAGLSAGFPEGTALWKVIAAYAGYALGGFMVLYSCNPY